MAAAEPVFGANKVNGVSSSLLHRAMSGTLAQPKTRGAPQPAESTADARRIAGDGDEPVLLGSIDLAQNASSGASQPTAKFDGPSPSRSHPSETSRQDLDEGRYENIGQKCEVLIHTQP